MTADAATDELLARLEAPEATTDSLTPTDTDTDSVTEPEESNVDRLIRQADDDADTKAILNAIQGQELAFMLQYSEDFGRLMLAVGDPTRDRIRQAIAEQEVAYRQRSLAEYRRLRDAEPSPERQEAMLEGTDAELARLEPILEADFADVEPNNPFALVYNDFMEGKRRG